MLLDAETYMPWTTGILGTSGTLQIVRVVDYSSLASVIDLVSVPVRFGWSA